MDKIKVTDEWLYQYMPVADEALIRGIEARTDYKYRFSEEFEQKMARLIRKEQEASRQEKWENFRIRMMQGAKKIAVFPVIIAAGAGLLALMAAMLQQQGAGSGDMSKSEEKTDGTEEGFIKRDIGYIPEGYHLVSENSSADSYEAIYKNDVGETLTFRQEASAGGSPAPDSSYSREETIQTAGTEIKIYLNEDGSSWSGSQSGNCVYVLSADQLSIKEIEDIYTNWML